MKIDRDEAARVAALAHLQFDEEGLERMAAEMTAILTYVDQLAESDPGPAGLEPAASLREDVPHQTLDRAAVEANAPAWREGFFVVPKVIGGD